jgi:hypothetical protein
MNARIMNIGFVIVVLLIAGVVDVRAEWVTVQRVIDGDTFVTTDGTRVRVRGIDTPETRHATRSAETGGQRATDFARGALEGRVVHLESTGRDQYGRRVAEVTLPGGVSYAGMVRSSGLDKKTNPYVGQASGSRPQGHTTPQRSTSTVRTPARHTSAAPLYRSAPSPAPQRTPTYTPPRGLSTTPATVPQRSFTQPSSRSSSSGSTGPVYVRGFTRSDGTYVAPHFRSAPGRGN